MSTKYPGGIITKNYVAPTPSSASGVWTLDQQEQAQKAGIWPFGGPFNYIEDVFSTYLYTGNGSTQTITNGIDLSTKGGLVWGKSRSNAYFHSLNDTARGASKSIFSNDTSGQISGNYVTAFNTDGFSLGNNAYLNTSGSSCVSWTFRKQPKFFDVVTWTGNSSTQNISHNLGSVPGCIFVKVTSSSGDWIVWHTSLSSGYRMVLNSTAAQTNSFPANYFGNNSSVVAPTSTQFTIGSAGDLNNSGTTYVAYVFASNAGGFGTSNTDNVISCGAVTLDGSGNAVVNLGYEPQWVMIKRADNTSNWYVHDTMRGLDLSTYTRLYADTSGAELTSTPTYIAPSSTGFNLINGFNSAGANWIYIAIRRGPMKVPTDATKVYNVISQTPSGTTTLTNSFASDMVLSSQRSNGGGWGFNVADKLRGTSITSGVASKYLTTPTTTAEGNFAGYGFNLTNTNVQENFWNSALGVGTPVVYNIFQRAPSFFDEVCYTGTGSATTFNHNLGVVPEMMIVKSRSNTVSWYVYAQSLNAGNFLKLDTTDSVTASSTLFNSTSPTSSVFTVGTASGTNNSTWTYTAYLFATCAGVSKVGSYTGNGSTQAIACGFAGGARFVMIKRTDSAGDWYVYDTARGMTLLTDPYLFLNSTAAESATLGSVTTTTGGFTVDASILAAVNTNAASYIYLAIA